ncbi:hypothetical protein [Streptomyces sp. NPDC048590]|uniref:hypothetical protein n=1 Tax=Streptomyces sp. NPDC048590 TaxID=3365574 RepID=UPI003714CFB4
MPASESADPHATSTPPECVVEEVLARFHAYARIRRSRDRILSARRYSPRDEQQAFDDLHRAMTRLRSPAR